MSGRTPPNGPVQFKVVLETNVVETSLTVDTVKVVIEAFIVAGLV